MRVLRWVSVLVVAVMLTSCGIAAKPRKAEATEEPALTSHQICIAQLMAIVTRLMDTNGGSYTTEVFVNGRGDPYLKSAMQVYPLVVQVRYAYGDSEALSKLWEVADSRCNLDLQDTVRPNYPQDGTNGY